MSTEAQRCGSSATTNQRGWREEALRARSRSREVRFRALVERALTFHAEGKLGLARKDLDRIRAEDASYPGLADALTALGLDEVKPDEVDDVAQSPTVIVERALAPTAVAEFATGELVSRPGLAHTTATEWHRVDRTRL